MTQSSASNGLNRSQRDLLLAVFSDCREYYTNRRDFDNDYKSLSQASLQDLYHGYKAFNKALVSGSFEVEVPILTHFPFSVARSTSDSVRAIRQVLGLYTRLEGHSDTASALSAYAGRVSASRGRCPEHLVRTARDLIASWLGAAPELMDLHPQHGPGAVAEKYDMLQKAMPHYTFRQLTNVGGDDLLYLNARHREMAPRPLTTLKHPITRVVCVPKDLMRPRIISAEPCVMQFLQQGVARYMMKVLEFRCPYLNFRDQSINARLSANWDDVATLDMSDASDTVSRRIVRQLFPADWVKLLFSLRSHFARLPDDTLVPLRAFAPMGSALCFPVESVVFAAISVAAYLEFCESEGEPSWLVKQRKNLKVYGDDIIVPRVAGRFVIECLRECGFLPNVSKCCFEGFFRESCGAEWWKGHDVTVVRPRSLNPIHIPVNSREIGDAMPMALHAKALFQRGFVSAAQHLASLCDFPVALGDGPGYLPPLLSWPRPGRIRWNSKFQRGEQEAMLPIQVTMPSDAGTGWEFLFLGLSSAWRSELVLTPRVKPKRKWVLAAPLADR